MPKEKLLHFWSLGQPLKKIICAFAPSYMIACNKCRPLYFSFHLANNFKRPWCWLKWPGLYGKGEERIRQNLRWDSVPYFLHLRYVYLWRTWCFAGHLFRELTVFNQATYLLISFQNKFRCYFQSSYEINLGRPKVTDHAGWSLSHLSICSVLVTLLVHFQLFCFRSQLLQNKTIEKCTSKVVIL